MTTIKSVGHHTAVAAAGTAVLVSVMFFARFAADAVIYASEMLMR